VPTVSSTDNPSLEHLKGQAKLVRDLVRAADAGGLSMVDEFHPRLDAADLDDTQRAGFKTADAQLIVARMYRFPSWKQLREHIAVVDTHTFRPGVERTADPDRSASFVENACLDYTEHGPSPADRIAAAHQLLATDPSVASGSIAALATVGDHGGLATVLDNSPDIVNEPCGPNGWPPLLYAVYSRITADNPDWSAAQTVTVLLNRGADPNAGFLWRGLVPPFTALTGAFGGGEHHQPWHIDRLTVARLLLDAGADPNDGQSLYNNGIGGQNHDDPAHLQLLVEHGLGTQHNGPWYQALGDQLRDPAELLNDELEAAAKRNRPTIFSYLASLGLDLDRPVGRSQQTPARIAATEGHTQILDILTELGVNTELTPIENALQHTRTNQTSELQQLLHDHPPLLSELQNAHPGLCENVGAGHADMLKLLIEIGFDINDRTASKTPLHHPAEANDVDLARLLIGHGADPNLADAHIGATPWGWANHFGHTETANYLHPLTRHGDPLPEITLHHANTRHTLATPELIEALLDHIHQEASTPLLVGLEGPDARLTIGLGRIDVSIALYLDDDNTPWHAVGDPNLGHRDSLSFASTTGEHVCDFYATAAVKLDTVRVVAKEFCRQPSIRPHSVTWTPEGNPNQNPA